MTNDVVDVRNCGKYLERKSRRVRGKKNPTSLARVAWCSQYSRIQDLNTKTRYAIVNGVR